MANAGALHPCYARCGGGTRGERNTLGTDAASASSARAGSDAAVATTAAAGDGATQFVQPQVASADVVVVAAAIAPLVAAVETTDTFEPSDWTWASANVVAALPPSPSAHAIVLPPPANNCSISGSNPQHPSDHTVASAVMPRTSRVNADGLRIIAIGQQYAAAQPPATRPSPRRQATRPSRTRPGGRAGPTPGQRQATPAAPRFQS